MLGSLQLGSESSRVRPCQAKRALRLADVWSNCADLASQGIAQAPTAGVAAASMYSDTATGHVLGELPAWTCASSSPRSLSRNRRKGRRLSTLTPAGMFHASSRLSICRRSSDSMSRHFLAACVLRHINRLLVAQTQTHKQHVALHSCVALLCWSSAAW